MCGIAGTVGYSVGMLSNEMIVQQFDVELLMNRQSKRGPDHRSFSVFGKTNDPRRVALGHNRLSILDLSKKGNQPMTLGKYTLTYNGEIYNYREMQSNLHANDDIGTINSGNDAYTLLQYWVKFGAEKALKDANGMYAYCMFDAEKQQINLVVDRFGQKPLYYCHFGDKFAFASSPAALLSLKDKWEIDEEGLNSFWLLGSVMGENSIWKGIKKLTGSHHLTYDIRENKISIERYWSPQFQENTNGIGDLIFDAINKVKVSDVPIYTFLSGGIDSTLVASQFEGGNAVHLGEKEWEYAKLAADKFKMDLIQVNPDDSNIEESLQDLAFQFGEPLMAGLIPYITAKDVSKFAKVAISANGADELFFGYDRTSQGFSFKARDHIFRSGLLGFDCPDKIFNDDIDKRLSEGRWYELNTYVADDLNKTLDAASMCHSLEVRSPFLDHRLVEMALSIPEGKHYDMRLGRKAILKRMLEKMGFSRDFLTRPKLGFSLHREPEGMQQKKTDAVEWCRKNNFLRIKDWNFLSGRDQRYLESSALSFYHWYKTWEHKL